jgi:hypothetical protein
MLLPDPPLPGEDIGGEYLQKIRARQRASFIWCTPGNLVTADSSGQAVTPSPSKLIPQTRSSSSSSAWQPYQFTPDPENPAASDWRTFRVKAGTVNNQHPIKDGSATASDDTDATESNRNIVLAASTTTRLWLHCTIETTAGGSQGTVTGLTIKFSNSGWWTGYPQQPTGDSATGAPPSAFYIALYSVTTSADSGDGSKVLTPPSVWSANSWWVDMVAFGQPTTDTEGNCVVQQRLTLGVV